MTELSKEQIDRMYAKFAQAERPALSSGSIPPPPPSTPNHGGGNGPDMEARIVKLEAAMEHVRSDLARLAGVPADLATIKERTAHLPTKADVKDEIKGAIDRAASRVQRNVAIVGGATAVAVAVLNNWSRLFG